MSNQNKKASAAPVGPWREGRPSFKAFRPEVFFLTILTIACLALGLQWSLTASKSAKKAPASAVQSEPETTPEASKTDPSAAEPTSDAASDVQTEPAAEPIVQTEPEVAQPVQAPAEPKSLAKYIWIWIACLIIPAILWCWRGWRWICAIYGVKYKLVCDLDNPKASTFLIIRGIFNKKTDSLHIAQIKDIGSSQSLIQKYLQGGVGTITLTTSDVSDPLVTMKNMDEPSRVFNAFDELRRHYWGRGGMQLNSGAVDAGDAVSEVHEM